MAILYQSASCLFEKLAANNPDDHEVLVGLGTLPRHSRKMVVVAYYIPPGLNVPAEKKCMDYITDTVLHVKRKYRDLYPQSIPKLARPKSMVAGDLFPSLVTRFADILAIPLTSVYN